ncbi:ferredoxin [Actinopolyspora sp. H202]|uniref:ferredoxin n=1 Tax=Actinopolyspora sp. H202 TaxID=1500456 RepID=UPI003EE6A89B
MRATARVDRNLCQGAGLCEAMGPELFRIDEEGYSENSQRNVTHEEKILLLQDIADCCPTGAISVTVSEQD